MGFFNDFADRLNDKYKELYNKQTGKRFDKEYNSYKRSYEFCRDDEVISEWEDIVDQKNIEMYPKRMALRDILCKRGLDFDEY